MDCTSSINRIRIVKRQPELDTRSDVYALAARVASPPRPARSLLLLGRIRDEWFPDRGVLTAKCRPALLDRADPLLRIQPEVAVGDHAGRFLERELGLLDQVRGSRKSARSAASSSPLQAARR
jgi:hypothetical protein